LAQRKKKTSARGSKKDSDPRQASLFGEGDASPGESTVALHDAAKERYLNYALSVITSRALPDVRDGLKPVQRRILFTMGQQGSNNPSKGAEGQYNPGEGNLKDDEQVDEYASGTGDGAQMEKKGKEMGNGAGSDERAEPTKYKGFWKKFTRETQKKAEEKK
jgi:hypothetical protein